MHIVHGLGYSLNWFIMGKGPRRRTDELPVLGGAVEAIVVVGELGKQKLTDAENAALQAALAQLRRHCD